MASASEGEVRCRLGLHIRACARDVEALAEHERHAAAPLCPVATTASLSETLNWSPNGLSDSVILVSINSQMSSS
jgi:hypothetical protein